MALFIGREEEKAILLEALHSEEPEMVSVIGRRRVGKTYLIKTVFKEYIDFEVTGVEHAPRSEQLFNFMFRLGQFSGSVVPLKTSSN